jgi:hypothetical protein
VHVCVCVRECVCVCVCVCVVYCVWSVVCVRDRKNKTATGSVDLLMHACVYVSVCSACVSVVPVCYAVLCAGF